MEGPNKAPPEIIEAWLQRPTPTKSRFCTPTKNPFCRVCYLAGENEFLFLAHTPTDRKRCPWNKQPHSITNPESAEVSENDSQFSESESESTPPVNRKGKLDFESPSIDTPSKASTTMEHPIPNSTSILDQFKQLRFEQDPASNSTSNKESNPNLNEQSHPQLKSTHTKISPYQGHIFPQTKQQNEAWNSIIELIFDCEIMPELIN